MSKKRSIRTRKKVVQAAKQRRKYRMGGSAFERAAERRKLDRTTTNTTPTPKKGALAKETTNTPGTVVAEPTRTTKEQSFYNTQDRSESEDNGEPRDRDIPGNTNTTSKEPTEADVTATERRDRAQRTATAAETLATGELDDNLKLADISEEGNTKLDSTIEGDDTTIDEFQTATAGQAAAPTATTVTEGATTKASLPKDFSLNKLNADLQAGVNKKFGGRRVQSIQNDDGTFSVIDRSGRVLQKYNTPQQLAADLGLRYESYVGMPGAAQMDAVKAGAIGDIQAAQGQLSEGAQASAARADFDEANKVQTASRDTVAEQAAQAGDVAFTQDPNSLVAAVTGTTAQVTQTTEAERQTREAITGEAAPDGTEAAINQTLGYEAAQRNAVRGTARTGAAASMVAEVGNLPPEITAAVVEDPATVTAQLDEQPVEVRAAVAALPTEALVSSQMETLLGGLETGEIPAWAKPAVSNVEQMLAQRGLSVSTVGRDALFNSIIQSAIPLAQSNAQALQSRAAQNLSNQQQANLAQATQDMQRRMANLANRQTAASQTAANAQQLSVLQSQFRQQAVLTTAEQQQQTRTQNLQNRQQAAVLNVQNQQAMNAQNLGNEQQIELANLEIANQTARENMTATNQERLAEMQVAADFLTKNAAFAQQMSLANLSNEQQIRLANLSALNEAGRDNLNAAQQTELAELNTRLQTNLTAAKIAADMNQAQLNVDQQRALQNAATQANVDLTKFNAAQQRELVNSKFMQTMTMKDFDANQQSAMQNATLMAQMDMQAADLATKTRIQNAQNFLKMDMANLSNKQQATVLKAQLDQQRMLSDAASENAARQFNATSENQVNQYQTTLAAQMEQFNASQSNAMSQFNAQQANMQAAKDADRASDVNKFNAQQVSNINQFNAQQENQRATWNAQNKAAVEASNVAWRRRANEVDTATQNAINMQNTMNAFNMSKAANAFLWQEVRDQADHDFRAYEGDQARRASIIIAALGADGDSFDEDKWITNLGKAIDKGLLEL